MKRVFSGIRPSGDLHIGNYLGAIRQWVKLQKDQEAFFCIVDGHAITTPHDPAKLRRYTLETAMIYLAAGIDPKRSTIFIQSQVPAHAELAWILGTMTPLGELERMTQFKEKARPLDKKQGIMAGLLNYPVLMAADILLYQADLVPVGQDQLQHVELARSIAQRFNNRYGKTFTVPKAVIRKETARIMSLADPHAKMSKSDENERGYILLTDSAETIRAKIKAAVTDSGKEIVYSPEKNRPSPIFWLFFRSSPAGPPAELEKRYGGKGYAEFKSDLAEVVVKGLAPFQKKFHQLRKNEKAVLAVLGRGRRKAAKVARKTLFGVKTKIGLLPI